jgi:hypothetical protein
MVSWVTQHPTLVGAYEAGLGQSLDPQPCCSKLPSLAREVGHRSCFARKAEATAPSSSWVRRLGTSWVPVPKSRDIHVHLRPSRVTLRGDPADDNGSSKPRTGLLRTLRASRFAIRRSAVRVPLAPLRGSPAQVPVSKLTRGGWWITPSQISGCWCPSLYPASGHARYCGGDVAGQRGDPQSLR